MTVDSAPPPRTDEISLLDLVVTVVESWRLLVLGPLAVGAVVYLALTFLPQQFEASAVVRLTADQVAKVRAPEAIDTLLAASGDSPATGAAARADMSRRIATSDWDEKTGEMSLAVSGTTVQEAEALLVTLVEQVRSSSAAVPPQGDLSRLQADLDAVRAHNDSLRAAMSAIEARLAPSDIPADSAVTDPESYARAFSFLAGQIQLGEVRMASIQRSMVALQEAATTDVPVVPRVRRTSSNPQTTAILSLLAALIALLIFVFARDAIRREMRNPESAGKVERIRNAMWRARRAKPDPADRT